MIDSFFLAKEVIILIIIFFKASLDVELLFTNISIDETIKNAIDGLFSDNIFHEKLSKSELYYLLNQATSESSSILDNILHK